MHRVALLVTRRVIRLTVELSPAPTPRPVIEAKGVTTSEAIRPLAKTRPALRVLKASGQ